MIAIRKSEERGHANHGWLDSFHTFSFASYHDPAHMSFRGLRVINEDRIAGGGGFGLHPHRDMEIVTWVLSGALEHRDSLGHSAVLRPGEAQHISAGTGIRHSEANHSPTEPVHLLQIWIEPLTKGLKPAYAQKSFAPIKPGQLWLIASRDGRDGSIRINSDADIFVAHVEPGDSVSHELKPGRHAWLQLIFGELACNGRMLNAGDGAAISAEASLGLLAYAPAQLLFFDLG